MGCQIRSLWIIKIPSKSNESTSSNQMPVWNDEDVIFSRKFPTAEKRARLELGESYFKIPSVSQLGPLILSETGLAPGNTQQFNPARDGCGKEISNPIYQVETREGTLWPLVAVDKGGYLFCCLPLVESKLKGKDFTKTSLLDIPSVASGFALLTGLQDFLLGSGSSTEISSRVSDLPVFLNQAAPFGVVRDSNADNILTRLNNKPCIVPNSNKLPAWKAASHKGKATLQLCVLERIKASQCAQEKIQDSQEVYGTITCRAELEGSSSDVTVSIAHTAGQGLGVALDGLTVHPCVQRCDWQELDNSRESQAAPRRLRFSAPNGQFTLCHYTVSQLTELPFFGVYEMKPVDESKVSINVFLKLNDQVRNNFDQCELHIPFYTRPSITHVEANPTQGTVAVSQRKVVVWNIGQKFTSKDQKVTLSATLTFSGNDQGQTAPSVVDAFCKGNNSYAQLYFKIQDFTHSGCHIDSKSIQVTPATKFKLSLSREYSSSDYKIWNSSGEGLATGSSCLP